MDKMRSMSEFSNKRLIENYEYNKKEDTYQRKNVGLEI